MSLFSIVRASGKELRRCQQDRAQRAFAPADSSLIAINSDGGLRAAGPGGVGGLPRGDRLVLFVIHTASAEREIGYWNEVIRDLDRHGPVQGQIEFWGVCDQGASCAAYQRAAAFPIFGYLDPYQMRIVALAGARGDALLYQGGKTRSIRVSLAGDAGDEAGLILSKST